jgi:hypothetical protein
MEKKMVVIRSMNELSQQIHKGNIFPVVSSLDSVALYFKRNEKEIVEIGKSEVNERGEYLLHNCRTKKELLENIQEFNLGEFRAEAFSPSHSRKVVNEINLNFPIRVLVG